MDGMGLYLHLSVSFFPHCGIGSVLPEDGAHPVPVSSRYRVEMAYMFWMDDFAGGYIKKLPIHRG